MGQVHVGHQVQQRVQRGQPFGLDRQLVNGDGQVRTREVGPHPGLGIDAKHHAFPVHVEAHIERVTPGPPRRRRIDHRRCHRLPVERAGLSEQLTEVSGDAPTGLVTDQATSTGHQVAPGVANRQQPTVTGQQPPIQVALEDEGPRLEVPILVVVAVVPIDAPPAAPSVMLPEPLETQQVIAYPTGPVRP